MRPTHKFAPDLRPVPYTAEQLTERFTDFLASLREKQSHKNQPEPTLDDFIAATQKRLRKKKKTGDLRASSDRIHDRVKALLSAANRSTGMFHLSREDKAKLEPILTPLPIAGPMSEAQADEIAACLLDDQPWMSPAIDVLWRDMRVSARNGLGLRFKPLLLDGPPSSGKTHLARNLSSLCGVPDVQIDVGSGTDGFRIAGSNRTWARGSSSRIIERVIETRVPNPIVFVDEIDKAGVIGSTQGPSTSIVTALLGLLEPRSATRWECPYFGVVFDMSRINWILASNEVNRISAPLRSRVRLVRVTAPSRDQLLHVAQRMLLHRGLDGFDLEVVDKILKFMPDDHPDLCLRGLTRVVDDLEALAQRPILN